MPKSEPTVPSLPTTKRLMLLSGNRCAFPKCTNELMTDGTVTGEMCHIAATRPGGPRYDPAQSPADRHAFENLIMLCPMHHKVIDDDEESYPVARLQKMKADHEARATTMPDAEASRGAQLLLSVNQSGGITAHTVNQTFHINAPAEPPASQQASTRAGMTFFSQGEALANAGFARENEFFFEGDRAHLLRLYPSTSAHISQTRLQEIFRTKPPCAMSLDYGGIYSRNSHGAIVIDPVGQHGIGALTQGMETGEIWGLNARLFAPHEPHAFPGESRETIFILPMLAVEKMYVRALSSYASLAKSEMQLPFPYRVELGGYGLHSCHLGVPTGPRASGEAKGPILQDAFRRIFTLEDDSPESLLGLLKVYFDDFYDLAAISRASAWTDEMVAAHGLPPR